MLQEGSDAGLMYDGERYLLVVDSEIRERDLADHTLSLQRESDGQRICLRAQDFLATAPTPTFSSLVPPTRKYRYRELTERLIAAGFSDRWMAQIAQFVKDHRLLQTGESEGR